MERPGHIPQLKIVTHHAGKQKIRMMEGTVSLPVWDPFELEEQKSSVKKKDHRMVKLSVDGDASGDQPMVTAEQEQAYRYLVQEEAHIQKAILEALLSAYEGMREQYGYDDDEPFMPPVSDAHNFRPLISLSAVHIADLSKDGFAYA